MMSQDPKLQQVAIGLTDLTVLAMGWPFPDAPFPPRPEGLDGGESFPWTFARVLRGETFSLLTENMPPEAGREQETHRLFGVKSSVVIPLYSAGKRVIGAVSF